MLRAQDAATAAFLTDGGVVHPTDECTDGAVTKVEEFQDAREEDGHARPDFHEMLEQITDFDPISRYDIGTWEGENCWEDKRSLENDAEAYVLRIQQANLDADLITDVIEAGEDFHFERWADRHMDQLFFGDVTCDHCMDVI